MTATVKISQNVDILAKVPGYICQPFLTGKSIVEGGQNDSKPSQKCLCQLGQQNVGWNFGYDHSTCALEQDTEYCT